MAQILSGAEVAAALGQELRGKAEALREQGVCPTLAILRVGERPDDISYEKAALKRAEAVGVTVRRVALANDASQEELMEAVRRINADDSIHGALLFRPLPTQFDGEAVRAALSPEKDVDGITDASLAGVFAGTKQGFPPCTAQACVEILDHYGIVTQGRKAVVVGRSLVVGKPVSMLLVQRHATVTICHTKTADMQSVTRGADILVVAAGRAGVIDREYVSAGQTVIDVGINFTSGGKLTGDVDFAAVEPIVGAISPVPGGVGTVTTMVLMKHVVEAAQRRPGA